jgi:hypothetical protein
MRLVTDRRDRVSREPCGGSDPRIMDTLDFDLDDVVFFELPTFEHAEAFRERFRPRFDGWSDSDEEGWLFTVRLDAETDLAGLLREAQGLVAELGLAAIRFCVDGRIYMLVGARPACAADLVLSTK